MKSHPAPPANTLASPLSNPELKTFLMNLQSRGYFADVNPSSEEYRVHILLSSLSLATL